MASWKEKGVVPDSEDEGSLDSDSDAGDAGNEALLNHGCRRLTEEDGTDSLADDGPRINDKGEDAIENVGVSLLEDDEPQVMDVGGDLMEGTEATVLEVEKSTIDGDDDALATEDNEITLLKHQELHMSIVGDASMEDFTSYEEPDLPPHTGKSIAPAATNRAILSSSSPRSPRAFKVPRPLWDSDHDMADAEIDSPEREQDQSLEHPLPAEDDVSTSYVRLTSPVSSILSSPPASQQSSASTFKPGTAQKHETDRLRTLEWPSTAEILPIADVDLPAANKREFRRRAPIQLHPYAMEQEKYRQSLKARGLRPMRLEQTQDDEDGTGEVFSPAPVSQQLEMQLVEQITEESQSMDFSWDSSQPLRNVEEEARRSQRRDGSVSSDDQEFPDVDELLRQRPKPPVLSKRRLQDYSKKSKRPRLSSIQIRRDDATNIGCEASSMLDVPASPLPTSSPFLGVGGHIKPLASQAISASSEQPTPSWLDQDELGSPTGLVFSTPPTSVTRPETDLISLTSNLEDDPFASDSSDDNSTTSNVSVQLRTVGKRIRGVLPASHLRLDQHLEKQKSSVLRQRDSLSLSPQKVATRRGVALPKALRATQVTSSSTIRGVNFFSDESSDEEDIANQDTITQDDSDNLGLHFPMNRRGLAEEDDRVDAMLPSGHRRKTLSTKPRRKKRVTSASLPRDGHQKHACQPRIAQHLVSQSFSKRSVNQSLERKSSRTSKLSPKTVNRPAPPRLSILDVDDFMDRKTLSVPQFIKVAARTARSRAGQGRQSPSKKFIRLADREDTVDAQSVLDDWKSGRIKARILTAAVADPAKNARPPLGRIVDNNHSRPRPSLSKVSSRDQASRSGLGYLDAPRRLVVSRRHQTSMNKFMSLEPQETLQYPSDSFSRIKPHNVAPPRQRHPKYRAPHARPGQLESSEVENSRQNPTAAFKSTKRALDTVFKGATKLSAKQKNLQLDRFLADDDIIRPSIENSALQGPDSSSAGNSSLEHAATVFKQRKRTPHRIDADAAKYRQPSEEPLIIDVDAVPQGEKTAGQGGKLTGLSKFGSRYATHFDIIPLQSGVFFHESTFIGSGRLSKALKIACPTPYGTSSSRISFRLGERDFGWSSWNADVSSQIGLVFDFLLEQLAFYPPGTRAPEVDLAEVVTNLVDYVQHHLVFESTKDGDEFISRMLEVVQEFLSRLAPPKASTDFRQPEVDVIARCTVLVFQVLQLSRGNQSGFSFQLENLLKSLAARCVKLCLNCGLDVIRKLYGDLQYLSFRERGIRADQYAIHAWVVISQVLGTARIPRGSFWDITNAELVEFDTNVIDDAQIMEKLWYSLFSLLPLCEFDEFGVLIPNHRRKVCLDNWSLPQQMLKRVFAMYSSNARQSPSFNDYCRALVGRCHYLITRWGWWNCNGMVGSLFDVFASHELAHLRNEEVYDSPRFLKELNVEPSLEVEPEDRCFHIFLKIVSLSIKHLRKTKDLKGIRNLVARLLPNHDRQYPKDEPITTRELAALRNHHDLLCTLYWASPRDYRPPLSLIQELVDAERSHKAACSINLRAWSNLSRFVFTSSDETKSYPEFISWQYDVFDKHFHQYLGAETEIRRQADLLLNSSTFAITEAELAKAVTADRRSTMATLQTLMNDINQNVKEATSDHATLMALNHHLLAKILSSTAFSAYKDIDQNFICSAVKTLQSYMDRIDTFYPADAPYLNVIANDLDSQGSLDSAYLDAERQIQRQMMIKLMPNMSIVTMDVLESRLCEKSEPVFLPDLITCWARLVSLVSEERCDLRDFVTYAPKSIFRNRQQYTRATKYWPLFLSLLLRDKGLEGLTVPVFDLGTEWMQIVTKPPALLTYETSFSRRMFEAGHYLLKSRLPLDNFKWLSTEREWPRRHQQMVLAALNSMREIKMDLSHNGFNNSQQLSQRETHNLFSIALKATLDSMQYQLESMIPGSASHTEYVTFCQTLTSNFRIFTNNIQALTEFFMRHSFYYWPREDDPQLYAAGILAYSLQLKNKANTTFMQLFYYLHSGWKNDVIHSRSQNHVTCVRKAMKDWAFTEFMLAHFVPATLVIGFDSPGGALLPKTYLPLLVKRVPHYLQRNGPEGATTFAHSIGILKLIINNVFLRAVNQGVSPDHQGVISIVCEFYLAVRPALLDYAAKYPTEAVIFRKVTSLMSDFFRKAVLPREEQTWIREQVDVFSGEYVGRFVAALQEDIEKSWVVSNMGHSVAIKSGPSSVEVSVVESVPRLDGVLKLGLCLLNDEGEEFVVRRTDYMGDGKAFPGVMPPIF